MTAVLDFFTRYNSSCDELILMFVVIAVRTAHHRIYSRPHDDIASIE